MKYQSIKEYTISFLKFLPLAAIITISHEFGHWLAAMLQGYRARIVYNCTELIDPFENEFQYFIFILGGPLSTWLICFMGLSLIFIKYRNKSNNLMSKGYQISLFSTFFCVRAVYNTTGWIISKYILGVELISSDEYKISSYLGWPPEFLLFGGFILGLFILFTCLFYFIPRFQRKMFLITGIMGGLLGYMIWYYWLGPVILPSGNDIEPLLIIT